MPQLLATNFLAFCELKSVRISVKMGTKNTINHCSLSLHSFHSKTPFIKSCVFAQFKKISIFNDQGVKINFFHRGCRKNLNILERGCIAPLNPDFAVFDNSMQILRPSPHVQKRAWLSWCRTSRTPPTPLQQFASTLPQLSAN